VEEGEGQLWDCDGTLLGANYSRESDAGGPPFYQEKVGHGLCLKQALNAFMGCHKLGAADMLSSPHFDPHEGTSTLFPLEYMKNDLKMTVKVVDSEKLPSSQSVRNLIGDVDRVVLMRDIHAISLRKDCDTGEWWEVDGLNYHTDPTTDQDLLFQRVVDIEAIAREYTNMAFECPASVLLNDVNQELRDAENLIFNDSASKVVSIYKPEFSVGMGPFFSPARRSEGVAKIVRLFDLHSRLGSAGSLLERVVIPDESLQQRVNELRQRIEGTLEKMTAVEKRYPRGWWCNLRNEYEFSQLFNEEIIVALQGCNSFRDDWRRLLYDVKAFEEHQSRA